MSTLLFIDPQTGEQLYYDELLNGVCAGSIDYAPWVQPSTHCEAVRALLTAVVLGQPLTFFDSDFSVVERESLGGTAVRLAERIRLPGGSWSDSDAMRSKALQQTGFALTLFTSGTTGRPKQVTHDVEGLTRMLKVSVVHESNVWGLAYNSTHIAGVQVILQAFFNGNILVNLFTASRETIVGALGNYKVSHISATPSFYRLLLPISRSVPSVRAVSLGGEPSDENLIKQLRSAFPAARVRNIYASTEVGTLLVAEGEVFTIPAEYSDRVAVRDDRLWVHRSLVGEVATGDESGNETDREEELEGGVVNCGSVKRSDGQGATKSPVNGELEMGNGEATKLPESGEEIIENMEALPTGSAPITNNPLPLSAPPDGDAWYDTGDVVEVVTEDPLRFRIIARDRDWVNVGGHKVNPHEVEELLRSHPNIRETRVFGLKNSVMGQVLCAEVVTAASPPENGKWKMKNGVAESDGLADSGSHGLTEPELRVWLGERLQAVKVPRIINFVDSISRTRTGKLKR